MLYKVNSQEEAMQTLAYNPEQVFEDYIGIKKDVKNIQMAFVERVWPLLESDIPSGDCARFALEANSIYSYPSNNSVFQFSLMF